MTIEYNYYYIYMSMSYKDIDYVAGVYLGFF